MSRKYIVTAPPPTPNGDLHVGHLAGPYLAADVFGRYQRMRGNQVISSAFSDDNQSYVVTSAAHAGLTPRELCSRCGVEIRETLLKADVHLDAFVSTTAEHNKFTSDFLVRMYNRGVITLKEKEFFYCEETGGYLFESYIKGNCPVCLAESKGGICETCGHPNNYTELLEPRATLAPDAPLLRRRVNIAVLELERFRPQFEAFYADKWSSWRPHFLKLVRECLRNRLPEMPMTYIHSYGIPAPFPGCEGQVINPWLETLTGFVVSTGMAAQSDLQIDKPWLRESGYELVQFFGYDNSYFYAFGFFAMLEAFGERYIRPRAFVVNEFYELGSFKFSTSLNNLIWARDLLSEYSADDARFYLAATNPQFERSSFTREGMSQLLSARLHQPWSAAVALFNRLGAARGTAECVATMEARRQGEAILYRFQQHYDTDSMDLRAAATQITSVLGWIGTKLEAGQSPPDFDDAWFLLKILSVAIEPLMPSFALRLQRAILDEAVESWDSILAHGRSRWSKIPHDLSPSMMSRLPNSSASSQGTGRSAFGRSEMRIA